MKLEENMNVPLNSNERNFNKNQKGFGEINTLSSEDGVSYVRETIKEIPAILYIFDTGLSSNPRIQKERVTPYFPVA